jgi:glutathione S-transferase
MGGTPDEAVIAAALPDARNCIGTLERLKGDAAFMAGDRLSIADLMLAPQLDVLAETPEGAAILQGTGLRDWLGRMQARASMAATRPERLMRAA